MGLIFSKKKYLNHIMEKKGHLFKMYSLGPQKQSYPGKKLPSPPLPTDIGGKRHWILLSNELVQDISDRNVCTKFGESM